MLKAICCLWLATIPVWGAADSTPSAEEIIHRVVAQDKILVKRLEAESKTKSGIVLPDAAKEKPTKGKVISVGPGALSDNGKRHAIPLKAGDNVYYGKWSGTEVEVDGTKFVILKESDVLGVLE